MRAPRAVGIEERCALDCRFHHVLVNSARLRLAARAETALATRFQRVAQQHRDRERPHASARRRDQARYAECRPRSRRRPPARHRPCSRRDRHGRARADPVALHQQRRSGGRDDDVGFAHDGCQIARARVADRDGRVALEQQQRDRLADEPLRPITTACAPLSATPLRSSTSMMPSGVQGRGRPAGEQATGVARVQAVDVLGGVDALRSRAPREVASAAAAGRGCRRRGGRD